MSSDDSKVNSDVTESESQPFHRRPWCRLHADFAFDGKTQNLSECIQRRFVMILCLQCSDDLRLRSDAEVATLLRISLKSARATKRVLIDANMIDDRWGITHWDKRQYEETDAARRMRESRERKRNGCATVAQPLQGGDATVAQPIATVAQPSHPRVRAQNSELREQSSEEIHATPLNQEPLASGPAPHAHANGYANGYPREGEPGYRPGGEAQAILDAKKAGLRGRAGGV